MTHKNIAQTQQDLIAQFKSFDDWTERYHMLISMGKKTHNFPEEKKTKANFVKGCQSQVWFDIWMENGRMRFRGTSDAAIVAGLIALLMKIYDDQTPQDILNTPPIFIEAIGFERHLSPTRSSGLYAMLQALTQRAQQELT